MIYLPLRDYLLASMCLITFWAQYKIIADAYQMMFGQLSQTFQ